MNKSKLYEDALKEAKEIAKRTDLSDEERADLSKRVTMIEKLKSDIAQEKAIDAALKDLPAEEVVQAVREMADQGDLGKAYAESDQFAQAKSAGFRGNSAPFEFKVEPTALTVGGSTPGMLVPQRIGGIEGLVSYPAKLQDIVPSIPTGSPSVSYFLETSETSAIGTVAEGAEKPNFSLTGALTTETVEVIAGMAAVTRQTLEDAPFLSGFINVRMTKSLRIVEEDQLLNGSGTSPQLRGFLNRTTSTLTQAGDTVIDAIYKAADKCLLDGGYDADAVVIKASDWQPIVLSKDANDRYYGTGPFAAAVGDTIWGLRVVKSNKIAANTVLVGAFTDASFIARRSGLVLRTSDSHADYFKLNKVAILLEERLTLGVPAPLAFCKLTLGV